MSVKRKYEYRPDGTKGFVKDDDNLSFRPWSNFEDEVRAFLKDSNFDTHSYRNGDHAGESSNDSRSSSSGPRVDARAAAMYMNHLTKLDRKKNPRAPDWVPEHEEGLPPAPGGYGFHPDLPIWLVAPKETVMPSVSTIVPPQDLGPLNRKAWNRDQKDYVDIEHNFKVSPSQLYEPLDPTSREVRMILLRPGAWSDPLSCTLGAISLDSKPYYEALSYCWGDATNTKPILINDNRTFQVTISLESALRHLRHPTRPKSLWIDAMCINQNDIEERGQQVSLMQDIYGNAREVHIWLGQDVPKGSSVETSRSAIRVLQCLASDFHIWQLPFWRNADPTIDPYDWNGPILLRAFVDFVSRSWWNRAWVVQEVALAPKATLHVGHVKIDWNLIALAATNLAKHRNTCCGSEKFNIIVSNYVPFLTKFANAVSGIQKLRRHCHGADFFNAAVESAVASTLQDRIPAPMSVGRHAWHSGGWLKRREKDEFLAVLTAFRSRQATDSRDKVFSLLGVISNSSRLSLPVPNYKASTNDVYLATAKAMIDHAQSLQILLEARNTASNTVSNIDRLPSWVPNWSLPPVECEDIDLFPYKLRGLYSACHTAESDIIIHDERLLHVRGLEIDSVHEIGDVMDEFHGVKEYEVRHSWEAISTAYYKDSSNPTRYPARPDISSRASDLADATAMTTFGPEDNNSFTSCWRILFADIQLVDVEQLLRKDRRLFSLQNVRVLPECPSTGIRRGRPIDLQLYAALELDHPCGKHRAQEYASEADEMLAQQPEVKDKFDKFMGQSRPDAPENASKAGVSHPGPSATSTSSQHPKKTSRTVKSSTLDRKTSRNIKQDPISPEPRKPVWAMNDMDQYLPLGSSTATVQRTFMSATHQRRFFITKTGYMGLGPPSMQHGDRIFVLPTLEVPVLLRSEGDQVEGRQVQKWQLVGHCFVQGIMDGEAVMKRWESEAKEIYIV